jgi:hypothetical protein
MTTNVIDSYSSLDDQQSVHIMRETSFRSKFSIAEDDQLRSLVSHFGVHNWHAISTRMPGRNARQCRERWVNYLSPTLNTSTWSPEEDQLLIEKHAEFGTRWVQIAQSFPHRTDGMVKNRFHVLQRREARDEELRHNCDPILMMMVLSICNQNPTRNESQSINSQPNPPAIIEPISPVDLEFDPWSENMDYEFFDF